MSQPFLGQISMFAGNFAIRGYAFCNGQLMAIAQNDALFALIGTTYGGDGQVTFALPNMQGRVPYHQGTLAGGGTYTIGEQAGVENITLTTNQIPSHTHNAMGNSADGGQGSPQNNFWGSAPDTRYSTTAPAAPMSAAAIGQTGGSQPHNNMLPFLCINFIIALEGIFPSQN
jgi:microcystin-dependent protein